LFPQLHAQSFAPGTFGDSSTTLGLSTIYSIGTSYATGILLYDLGSASVGTSTASGSYGTHGVAGDLGVGHIFTLWTGSARTDGFRAVLLDVGAHVGDTDERGNSFVDSTGTLNGNSYGYSWQTGIDAKLSVYYYLSHGIVLSPFVKGGFDYAFSTNLAVNAAIAGTPQVVAGAFDRTIGRFEGGLELFTGSKFSFIASAYYDDGSTLD